MNGWIYLAISLGTSADSVISNLLAIGRQVIASSEFGMVVAADRMTCRPRPPRVWNASSVNAEYRMNPSANRLSQMMCSASTQSGAAWMEQISVWAMSTRAVCRVRPLAAAVSVPAAMRTAGKAP